MKELLKSRRGLSLYLGLAVAVAACIAAAAYAILDFGDITFSWITVFLLLLGAVLILGSYVLGQGWVLLAGSASCSVALGELLRVGLPSVSDIWNGVTFIGGNGALALRFMVVLAVISILSCVLCFIPTPQGKP